MVLTADHAAMPDPAVSGGYQISTGPMQEMINERFGRPGGPEIVELMQPTQAFLNLEELEANGHTVDDVARFMMTFTQAQTAGGGVVPNPGRGERHRDGGGLPVGDDAGPAVPARGEAMSRCRAAFPARRSRSSILWRFPTAAGVGCGLRRTTDLPEERTRSMAATDTVKAPAGEPPASRSSRRRLGLARLVVADRRLRAADAARARLEVPGRSEPVGTHARPRLVHVARPGDHRRRPGPRRRGVGARTACSPAATGSRCRSPARCCSRSSASTATRSART